MSLTAKISADITNFEKNLDKAMRQTDSFTQQLTQKLDKVGDSFINVGKKVSVLSAVVLAAGVASYKMAADFEDAMGASDQIFNDSSDEITDWAKNLKSQYGIAKTEALTMANTMGAMLKNIGQLTESEASKQAAMLVELSGDLAAMFGGTSQDAARALTGALKGNNTMLDNYGMGVNDATVKLKAFELGLMEAKGEMSLQVKQAATLALIMEQSGDAMGQAAREAEGGSGSMRRFTTEIKNLSTSLGEILLPIITPIISKVALFAKSLNELDPSIKKVIVTVGLIAAAAGPALLALGALLKLAPLIAVAFTAMTGPVGIAIAGVAAGALLIITNWEKVSDFFTTGLGSTMFDGLVKTLKTIGFLTYSIGLEIEKFLKVASNEWNNISNEQKDWNDVMNDSVVLFNELTGLWEKSGPVIENVTKLTGKYSGELARGAEKIKETTKAIDDNVTALGEQLAVMTQITALPKKDTTVSKDGIGSEPMAIVTPTLNFEIVKDQMGQFWEYAEEMSVNLAENISSSINNVVGSMANSLAGAIASGDNVIAALSTTLLDGLGNLAISVGVITMGIGEAFAALFTGNPIAGIAVGAGLIALGVAMKAGAAAISNAGGSTASGGASSNYKGGYDYNNLGETEKRGAYTDQQSVTFKIEGNTLVGILEKQNTKRNRTI